MNALAYQVSTTIDRISTTARYIISGILLLCAFAGLLTVQTDYTRETRVEATVFAKTQGAARKSSGTEFILALRLPDGTLQDVRTTFAQYSVTEVGSKWGVMVSDSSRGLPMPRADKLLLLGFVLTLMGGIWCLFYGMLREL
jgi:hypothetical protein